MHSSVPDGPALAGWRRVGRLPDEREFIIGGEEGFRFYWPRRPRVRRDVVAEVWASKRRPREIVRGDELTMGRNFFDGAPDPVAVDQAAIARGVTEARAVADARMADGHRFIVENGHAAVAGHADVGQVRGPDLGSDPDSYGADASDT
jgi:hypothetical protein